MKLVLTMECGHKRIEEHDLSLVQNLVPGKEKRHCGVCKSKKTVVSIEVLRVRCNHPDEEKCGYKEKDGTCASKTNWGSYFDCPRDLPPPTKRERPKRERPKRERRKYR